MIQNPIIPHQGIFFSILYREDLFQIGSLINELDSRFGNYLAYESEFFPMKNYYAKEMGSEENLKRKIIFFLLPLDQSEDLVELKLWTMKKERESFQEGRRIFNLDPGLISLENLQLLTSKPYSHRIHLGGGVYSDLTYQFKEESYQTLPWTYPDYADSGLLEFFNYARRLFKHSLTKS